MERRIVKSEWRMVGEFRLSIRQSPLTVRLLSMLILAIDTALDACAAAVLDTETGRLIAQEL